METNTNINNNVNNSNHKLPLYLIFGGITLLLMVVLLVWRNKQSTLTPPWAVTTENKLTTPTPIVHSVFGSLTISSKTGSNIFSLGQPITLVVSGDSQGKDVVGYDVLFQYPSSDFSFVSKTSATTDFQAYSFVKDNQVSITGAKGINVKTATVFNKMNLVEITFQPKTAGKFTFTIKRNLGKETSKFVDSNTKVYYPSGNSVVIEVK
jgi:hypothetical protein